MTQLDVGYRIINDRGQFFGGPPAMGIEETVMDLKAHWACVGDGRESDGEKIQNAINFAIVNRRSLYAPPGLYNIDGIDGMDFYNTTGWSGEFNFYGSGRGTVFESTDSNDAVLSIRSPDVVNNANTRRIIFRNFRLKGGKTGIYTEAGAYNQFHNLYIDGQSYAGIDLTHFQSGGNDVGSHRNIFRNLILQDITGTNPHGVRMSGHSHHNNFQNIVMTNVDRGFLVALQHSERPVGVIMCGCYLEVVQSGWRVDEGQLNLFVSSIINATAADAVLYNSTGSASYNLMANSIVHTTTEDCLDIREPNSLFHAIAVPHKSIQLRSAADNSILTSSIYQILSNSSSGTQFNNNIDI